MELPRYLDRIGYAGPLKTDLGTLSGLLRAHLLALPWENFDIHRGARLDLTIESAFERLVNQRRGGWCYEMNGVFGWALEEIGFSVRRVAAGGSLDPDAIGPLGHHLILEVELDGELWMADAGFADGPVEPFRLIEGPFSQRGFDFRLERKSDEVWRLHNHAFGARPFFDFGPTDEGLLAEGCTWQQCAPESPFVQTTVAFHHDPVGYACLVGKVERVVTPAGVTRRELADLDDFIATLDTRFHIALPDAETIWAGIWARHDALLAAKAAREGEPA